METKLSEYDELDKYFNEVDLKISESKSKEVKDLKDLKDIDNKINFKNSLKIPGHKNS